MTPETLHWLVVSGWSTLYLAAALCLAWDAL